MGRSFDCLDPVSGRIFKTTKRKLEIAEEKSNSYLFKHRFIPYSKLAKYIGIEQQYGDKYDKIIRWTERNGYLIFDLCEISEGPQILHIHQSSIN